MAFIAGYNRGVTWQLVGAGAQTALNVTGHSWAEMVDKLDVTHTGTAGEQAVIGGVLRGDGNVKANLNDAQPIANNPPFLRAGQKGLLRFDVGTTTPTIVPALILKVNYQSTVEGKIEYDFDVTLDSLTGTFVRAT